MGRIVLDTCASFCALIGWCSSRAAKLGCDWSLFRLAVQHGMAVHERCELSYTTVGRQISGSDWPTRSHMTRCGRFDWCKGLHEV